MLSHPASIGIGDPNESSPIMTRTGPLLHDGKEVKSRLEEDPLRLIAKETQGEYLGAHTRSVQLGTIYLEAIAGKPLREASVDALPLYKQRYPWFLLPAFALFAIAMALPDRLPRLRPGRLRRRSPQPRAGPGRRGAVCRLSRDGWQTARGMKAMQPP